MRKLRDAFPIFSRCSCRDDVNLDYFDDGHLH